MISSSSFSVGRNDFSPIEDAQNLKDALENGQNDILVNILTNRTTNERIRIAQEYNEASKDLQLRLSGEFAQLLTALLTPLPKFYAKELRYATKGLGTDSDILIEILCTLSNNEMKSVLEAYQEEYQRNLQKHIKDDTSGSFKGVLISLCQANRSEELYSMENAKYDAKSLYNSGEKRWGTDDPTFIRMFTSKSFEYLGLIFEEYQKLSPIGIEKAIESEFSGDIKNALLAIVGVVDNKNRFFATELHKALSGFRINNRKLIRIIVTRCENDMEGIKREYEILYSNTLGETIKNSTSGDYRKCLLSLIKAVESV